jgi:hypothetical protein
MLSEASSLRMIIMWLTATYAKMKKIKLTYIIFCISFPSIINP